jgi:ribonucleoside-diphosphate reductase alpha chain
MLKTVKRENGQSERPPVKLSENSLAVLKRRYLRRGLDGKPAESVTEMFERVAVNIAAAEEEWQGNVEAAADAFYELLTKFRFLPNKTPVRKTT